MLTMQNKTTNYPNSRVQMRNSIFTITTILENSFKHYTNIIRQNQTGREGVRKGRGGINQYLNRRETGLTIRFVWASRRHDVTATPNPAKRRGGVGWINKASGWARLSTILQYDFYSQHIVCRIAITFSTGDKSMKAILLLTQFHYLQCNTRSRSIKSSEVVVVLGLVGNVTLHW